jgi:hypothetical protein
MTTLTLDVAPTAVNLTIRAGKLIVHLADGRDVVVPIDWYPRLANATRHERLNWHLLGNGYAIEWPDIDEHIGIEGLIAGNRSGESRASLNRWLKSRKPCSRRQ